MRLHRKYSSIPHLRGDDNVIPSASDIPRMIGNLSHPRKRSVSVGPQSVADAYETIAYRNKKRRESLVLLEGESLGSVKPTSKDLRSDQATNQSRFLSPKNKNSPPGVNLLPTPMQSRVQSYEHMMGTAPPNISLTPPETEDDFAGEDDGLGDLPGDEEKEDREIFMKIERPRVRYDVEVVTKLIVYSGEFSFVSRLWCHVTNMFIQELHGWLLKGIRYCLNSADLEWASMLRGCGTAAVMNSVVGLGSRPLYHRFVVVVGNTWRKPYVDNNVQFLIPSEK